MEKQANYFIVGIFVSASLLALVGFCIWLMGVHEIGTPVRYTVYFTDPVSGLTGESPVKYKGVEVGKVRELRLTQERSDLVKVDIQVKEDTPVKANTTARIAIQGITGTSYIELSTSSGDMAPPQRVADEQYPVLKGTGSQLGKFFDTLPDVNRDLETTLAAIGDFSKEGQRMTESIKALADSLKENPSQILSGPTNKGVSIPK
jgi:phospholipid/cholesterol/gamma-HCH transport system substrate-binding protein